MLTSTLSHKELAALSPAEVDALCSEIRCFLLEHISKTGGHLASNLGAVELTVAIHRVFDTEKDRLVFDVGHQCYVHKLLTGRADRFGGLRQFGGLSGFPKPEESIHDAFIAGHASNSVSVALGMARARTRLQKDYCVLALIGDGALTGGLSYEGLNDAGASEEPLIVILNDNGMSIDKNVGGVSSHLSYIRTRASYYTFKKCYHAFMNKLPGGRSLYRFNHKLKTSMKKLLFPCTMFEDMGFTYLGPVNGHNVEELCHVLRWARELHRPVLLHVKTRKGKGYEKAEETPGRYHGVSPFSVADGVSVAAKRDFSAVFGDTMASLAKKEPRLCAITAAMGDGTGLDGFSREFPDRFFDVGIAEGHAVSMASGMAKEGLLPVFAVYSTFLQRGYDMLHHDTALQNLHVVFAVDRAGLVGADGPTHHGVADVGYLSQIPNMTVLAPSSFQELSDMLEQAILYTDGPVAVRYPRGGEGRYKDGFCRKDAVVLREGRDITIVSFGILINEVLDAADCLAEKGISAEIIKLNTLAPLMVEEIIESVEKTDCLMVVEDSLATCSLGSQLAARLAELSKTPSTVILKNSGDAFTPQGTVPELYHHLQLDGEGIVNTVCEVLHGKSKT